MDRAVLAFTLILVGLVALRAIVEAAAAVAGPGIALGAGYGVYRLCWTGKTGLLLRWGKTRDAGKPDA